MKILLCFVLSLFFLSSCASVVPLTRDYANKNVSTFETNLSVDMVWSKVIDFFSEKGISIQTVDKSSGLIVSGIYSFTGKITVEKGDGFLNNDAWVVCGCMLGDDGVTVYPPNVANGNFNVRVKEDGAKTKLIVNLVNLDFRNTVVVYGSPVNVVRPSASTGGFEKMVAKYVDPNSIKVDK